MHDSLHQGAGHRHKILVPCGLGTDAGRKDLTDNSANTAEHKKEKKTDPCRGLPPRLLYVEFACSNVAMQQPKHMRLVIGDCSQCHDLLNACMIADTLHLGSTPSCNPTFIQHTESRTDSQVIQRQLCLVALSQFGLVWFGLV